ncbi:MAG: protein kinase [Candidatus Eisenbacteria bacterium]|uniref:Protein kinase n=1 Tax=Eiseniibacteriota bacterium TaxID=2212470 RepID=A0A7Y2H1T8_UNCEI|nr:protein kinase [Candidatus Eisenbacteria bacterium]
MRTLAEHIETASIANYRKGNRLNGRYVVLGKIGTGWEGITYKVRDRFDGRTKALKLITNVRRRKSILSQARVLVRLKHPNIIDYFNVDRLHVDGQSHYFLLVDYLEGPRLSEVIKKHHRKHKKPNLFYMLRVFYQICRGMAYVHDQRILHDDLHTDNIIVTGDPTQPIPKLFDFWGTQGARKISRRSFDLQCAGQVLFECMTGKETYKAKDLGRLPDDIAAIIRRAHGRVHNYKSFHEIIDDLEELRSWD